MTQSVEKLMRANLLEAFGERDPGQALGLDRAHLRRGVVFLDPDEVTEGRVALNAKAQRLLDDAPEFVFSPAGPVYVNHDMRYLAWNLGPAGAPPVVKGIDTRFIEDGRIAKVYTILLAEE
jgi:hypothetical protein